MFNNKIKINYSKIDFDLSLTYFFIDNDLILGENFNHVIFTKYEDIPQLISSR